MGGKKGILLFTSRRLSILLDNLSANKEMIKVFALVFGHMNTSMINLYIFQCKYLSEALVLAYAEMKKQGVDPENTTLLIQREIIVKTEPEKPDMTPVKSELLDKVGLMNYIVTSKDKRVLEANASKFNDSEMTYLKEKIAENK